ncbi:probable RNA-binding protein 19 isoform X2 [Apis mellifera]|uniref:Probable RNA-binding protein 19 isoform X2 n=1 Tax=Apis mellifera TaxID=7460 RepID=A0A7M7MQ87_APIME|nr:probable RNA-binding protein 19 isoform X2 [Apis mellifera]|eukprot:XP_026299384.1 probable RNA-binding protein 19 isoform X2 [Apis mellifera]
MCKFRSWSKYASDSSKNVINNKQSSDKPENVNANKTTDKKKEKNKKDKKEENVKPEVKEALEKHKNDPLFMEFLESHTNKAIWNNDTILTTIQPKEHNDNVINNIENDIKDIKQEEKDEEEGEGEGEEEEETKEKEQKIAHKVVSDLEYMEALKNKEKNVQKKVSNDNPSKHGPLKLFTVKLRGLAYNHKKKDIKQFFNPLKAKSIRISPKIKGIAYVGFKTPQHLRKALLKNKSFLDGRQIFVIKYETKEQKFEEEQNENNHNIKWKKQAEALKSEESIAESGRMFIRNLSYTTTEDDIRKLFEKYGPLTEVNLPIDRITRKLKGFGTITFLMTEHAVKAYSELDGSILDGRMLHLLPAKMKIDSLEDKKELTYKQKKELKAKTTARSSHNWNTLFLGQNAVANAIATTYNTTKENVLEDRSKGLSAAVKLALGETQLVQDTKNFLEENGVCLDAFNQPSNERSKTIILAKNLPAATSAQEIRQLFARHGELGRVVMPPSGITALVEFLEPSEARKAYTKLAYTKYKYLPLYLEWAPHNSFITPPAVKNKTINETKEKIEDEKQEKELSENVNDTNKTNKEESEDEEEPEPDTTLFVKNINFSTTDEQLKTYFDKCGPLHYVSIAMKKDPKNPGAKLSMGYGFVRYKRKADADRALKVLQMTVLDGKTLELKRSERTLTTDVKSAKKTSTVKAQTGTKILIRNVPFQATAEEITELFKAFGELKAVRLPKKLVGVEKHRGFAFVEYYTKSEAKKAFKALCQSTHLYGRRLVLEWAQTEEGVEDIRKRTAKHFYHDQPIKKSKKATFNLEDVASEDA